MIEAYQFIRQLSPFKISLATKSLADKHTNILQDLVFLTY